MYVRVSPPYRGTHTHTHTPDTRAEGKDSKRMSGRIAPQDIERLKHDTDLLAKIGADTALQRRGSTNGGEYKGPCPKCGGEDRLIVQPQATPFPRWTCRQCVGSGAGLDWQDAIGYVMWRDGVSFVKAIQTLDPSIELVEGTEAKTDKRKTKRVRAPVAPPPDTWRARARQFHAYAQRQIWENEAALDYLRRDRGLSDETILLAGLGYNPKETRDPRERWGLSGRGKVTLPAGWVIPCYLDGVLWWVRVRRHAHEVERGLQKYHALEGSVCKGVVYGLDTLGDIPDVVICEGVFDALLLRQYLGGLANVLALGTASTWPTVDAKRTLIGKRVATAFDDDTDGAAARETWANVARPLIPSEHDVTDMWRAGLDLAAWIMPSLGPQDPTGRAAWCDYHLRRLDTAAFNAGANEADPSLREWLALYSEYERLGWGDGRRQKASKGVALRAPGPAQEVPMPEKLARDHGGVWTLGDPPDGTPEDLTGGRLWFACDDGRLVSVT